MKYFNKENWFKIMSVMAILILLLVVIIDRIKFPVKYIICGYGYTDCFIDAKFTDMRSCQRESYKGKWSCDESNSNDIRCRVVDDKDSQAVSYCKD